MTGATLNALDITNFRSIRGNVHAPLDAKVVLVHGENGAGKTSLLSAIELALTGRVISLERADPAYASQLLHRGATAGRISLHTSDLGDANSFGTVLSPKGTHSQGLLPPGPASFFSERCYLPQALLGQLLQIYQDSDSSPDSPLARFVTELLGLDRLDAIETGLLPVADLRNFRKSSAAYAPLESEKQRLDRLIADHQEARSTAERALTAALSEINAAWKLLGQSDSVLEADLATLSDHVALATEDAAAELLVDQRRSLDSLRRGLSDGEDRLAEASLADAHRIAADALSQWTVEHGTAFEALGSRVAKLLPTLSIPPSDTKAWHEAATAEIAAAGQEARALTEQTEADSARKAELASELEVERKNLLTIDAEIALISDNAGSLAEMLAEITAHIDSDFCPVCDRNFAERQDGALIDHVHAKVIRLSGSAERLLALGRNRGTQQDRIDRLVREQATLAARELAPQTAAGLARRAADLDAVAAELVRLGAPIADRIGLLADETGARRALNEHQARSQSRAATAGTLSSMAIAIGLSPLDPLKPLEDMIGELEAAIEQKLAPAPPRRRYRAGA